MRDYVVSIPETRRQVCGTTFARKVSESGCIDELCDQQNSSREIVRGKNVESTQSCRRWMSMMDKFISTRSRSGDPPRKECLVPGMRVKWATNQQGGTIVAKTTPLCRVFIP